MTATGGAQTTVLQNASSNKDSVTDENTASSSESLSRIADHVVGQSVQRVSLRNYNSKMKTIYEYFWSREDHAKLVEKDADGNDHA